MRAVLPVGPGHLPFCEMLAHVIMVEVLWDVMDEGKFVSEVSAYYARYPPSLPSLRKSEDLLPYQACQSEVSVGGEVGLLFLIRLPNHLTGLVDRSGVP